MNEKKESRMTQGVDHEGRNQVYLDVDRMINEGMSGGSVHARHDSANIEEARDLYEEEPPYECP